VDSLLGSPSLHPQFILGALFLRREREKVHTVVEAWLKRAAVGLEQSSGPTAGRKIQEATVQIEVKDNARKWLWSFLVVLVMSQIYFVRELLAAFALFAVFFALIAVMVATLYTLQNCCKLAVARLSEFREPVLDMASVGRENQKAA
jgi:hypothetical protein